MNALFIAWLTFHEARRRRLLVVGFALGVAFLVVYALGIYFLHRDIVNKVGPAAFTARAMSSNFTMIGLYAVNFLVAMISVLASVDTVSGEIASHSIQSIVTKPLQRWEVLLGKWIGFAAMIAALVLLLAGGVVAIGWIITGFVPGNLPAGLMLMVMVGWLLLSLSLLGGTLFSTLTNGVFAFMLFIVGFIGGWTEQIGSLVDNSAAVNIGILSSLLIPTEAVWRRAAYLMQPPSLASLIGSPFITTSVPSPAMVVYAVLYGLAALALAIWVFQRRDL